MNKKNIKRGLAFVLSVAIVFGFMPFMNSKTMNVRAAENIAPQGNKYATVSDLMTKFTTDRYKGGYYNTIFFGRDEAGEPQKWSVGGKDERVVGDNIVLLAQESDNIGQRVFAENTEEIPYSDKWECIYEEGKPETVSANHYGASKLRSELQELKENTTCFNVAEQAKMNQTTIYTMDTKNNKVYSTTDYLYVGHGDTEQYNYPTFFIGSNSASNLKDSIAYNNGWQDTWLRTPGESAENGSMAYSSSSTKKVSNKIPVTSSEKIIPIANLNLEDVAFASAVPVATAGSLSNQYTLTLRYKAKGSALEGAILQFNEDETSINLGNVPEKSFLVVQSDAGAYGIEVSDTATIQASDVTIADKELEDFKNCKVWIENVGSDGLLYAKGESEEIPTVAISNAMLPEVGKELETTAVCTTDMVATKIPEITWTVAGKSVTGLVEYNRNYTANITLTAEKGCVFSTGVTAWIDGLKARKVTLSDNGTTLKAFFVMKTEAKKLDERAYVTKDNLMDCFSLDKNATAVGKIRFGADDRTWLIAGAGGTDTLTLLATTSFGSKGYDEESSIYGDDSKGTPIESDILHYLRTTGLTSGFFTTEEVAKIKNTTVTTEDYQGISRLVTAKLYLPAAESKHAYGDTTIYLGKDNDIPVSVGDLSKNGEGSTAFWLRSTYATQEKMNLMARSGQQIFADDTDQMHDIVPAFDLDMADVLFASEVPAATVAMEGDVTASMVDKTYTLRYDASKSKISTFKVRFNDEKTALTTSTVVPEGTFLVVQNSDGTYAKAVSSKMSVAASEVTIGGKTLTDFENCKIWLEKTDGNITYAKEVGPAPVKVAESDFVIDVTNKTYTGSEIKPTVTPKGNITLSDYEVSYSNNVNVGTATITITGKEDYTGTITKHFAITPQPATSKFKTILSTTKYTYNGKTKTPVVTGRNADGMNLVRGRDFDVKYASGRKYVGKYSVVITYKGNYSGTRTLYFTINPKGTSLKKITASKKSFTAKWKKVKTQVSGYQIRYSTSSKFKGAKTTTIKSYKTTSKKIKKLRAKKKYYVQVRTYKKVSGTTYYSAWSKKKVVKTK